MSDISVCTSGHLTNYVAEFQVEIVCFNEFRQTVKHKYLGKVTGSPSCEHNEKLEILGKFG
jgi:hypothetical protein